MARAPARQELFLSVGGSVAPLTGALKVGKTALIEFSDDAEKAFEAVERSMRDMVKDPGAAAKQLTQSYSNAFREIRANAQNVLGANDNAGALTVLNANAAREAATAAENRAAAIRVVAEAARAEAIAQGSANAQLTAYAAAATTAERDAEQYAIALREQANALSAVEGRMGAIVEPGRRVVQMSGQARAGMQQLSFQLGDVATQLAAGTPPSIIFAQQISQVTQAIGLMAEGGKGVLGFLSLWGPALGAVMVVLTPLVAKLFEKSEADKKAEEAAKEHAKAIEALIAAQDRAVLSTQAQLRQNYIAIGLEREKAIRIRETTQALLEQAKAQYEAARSQNFGAAGGAGAGMAQSVYAGRVTDLEDQLKKNSEALDKLNKAFDRAAGRIVQESVSANSTPEGRINRRYDGLEDAARVEAERSKDFAKYARTLARLDAERQRELKALQESNRKKPSSSTPTEERSTPKVVGGILRDTFGGTITSTTGGKHVAGSYHYRGQAVDFVPAGGMGSVTKAQVRAALEAQGVQIKELLGPGDKGHSDHFHVAFAKSRQSRAAIEKAAEQQRQRELTEDISFGEQERRAKSRRLDALGKSAISEEQREQLLRQEIDAEALAEARKIGLQLSKGNRTEAEARQLLAINEETRQARLAAITKAKATAEAEKQLQLAQGQGQNEQDLLQAQLELTDNRQDRARLEKRLLDLQMQQERLELDAVIASTDATDAQKEIAKRRRAMLGELQRLGQQAIDRSNESPLDRYKREIYGDIGDQLDDIQVDGLRRLGDALEDSAVKALGLKGALGDIVGQLIRIGIERQILGPLADALFGGGGGAGGGGLFGSIFKFLGFADGGRPDRAVNGRISGPGAGRSDSILALLNGTDPILVSNGESIVNAEATQRYWPLIDAMNRGQLPKFADGGMLGNLPRSVSAMPANDLAQGLGGRGLTGEVRLIVSLTDDLDMRIDNRAAGVAVQVVRESAPAIVDAAAASTAAQLRRPGL